MLSITALTFNVLRRRISRTKVFPCAMAYNMMSTDTHSVELTDMVRSMIPPLTFDMYKGQCGRIGVVGGCKEYTGAPYFAAISLLKVGADLSHVFCTEAAAPVIKSYSPELIVHPLLDQSGGVEETCEWLIRLHALVIGPGLGRQSAILSNVKSILIKAKELSLPLVIDADGVFLLSQDPDLIRGYTRAILTPNAVEFNRLYTTVMGSTPDGSDLAETVSTLSSALGNVTVVCKGPQDIVSDGKNMLICSSQGSPRRCGGQGDLLSGSMGTFTYWAHKSKSENPLFGKYGPTLCAAYAACLLTRECSRVAYSKHGRSTMTTHLIEQVQQVFEELYGSEDTYSRNAHL